jgi:hypothetical protein
MPVVNTDQARVELTRAQFLGIVEHVREKFSRRDDLPEVIFIEETNLGSTLVVGGRDGVFRLPTFLAYGGGEIHELREVSDA